MSEAVAALIKLLDLDQLEADLFRGDSPADSWQRVFGGQVIGQALVAASRTVTDRAAHSLHGYFLRPGDPKVPIQYEVDRIRDGRSFATRRVVACQHARAIFNMSVSFQVDEPGLEHQFPMPVVTPPEQLMTERERREGVIDRLPEKFRDWFLRERPIEMRPVEATDLMNPVPSEPFDNVWMRAVAALPDDPILQKCVLAYASDMSLLDTALRPHGVNWFANKMQVASLDHALWFHRPFRMDEWMLYAQDGPSSSGGRGFNRGSIYTRDGVLVASVAQEALIRVRE